MDWKSLAIQLEMSGTKIQEIDVNNRGRVSDCRRDMIEFWLQSDISCSWQKLIDALTSSDQSVLAEEIRVTYCPMYQGQLIKMLRMLTITFILKQFCHSCFTGALCEPMIHAAMKVPGNWVLYFFISSLSSLFKHI